MTFDEAVETLRGWRGQRVVVVLEPDHSVMEGPLEEIDSAGIDGALFSVSPTGVAIALFRDAFVDASRTGYTVRISQGRVEIVVSRRGGTAAPTPGR